MVDAIALQRNLLTLYRMRTASDEALGSVWYRDAHQIVCQWADTYGHSLATTACVTAALSPQVKWEHNLIIADDILAGRQPSIHNCYLSNIHKAQRIRDDRATQILPYFPSGPKVASFAANLAGDYSIVTVDAHCSQAALDDVTSRLALPWTRYAIFADAYRRAARAVKREPAVFQAVIWHAWKRLHPPARKRALRQQWSVMGEF